MEENKQEIDSDENSHFNSIYFLIHMILVIYFVQAEFSYHGFGSFGSWSFGILSVLLPGINSIVAYFGMINYWDINWLIGLAIFLPSFFLIFKKQTHGDYVLGIILLVATIACTHILSPVFETKQQMKSDFEYDSRVADVILQRTRNAGLLLQVLKQYRVKAKRAGFEKQYDEYDLFLKALKRQLK